MTAHPGRRTRWVAAALAAALAAPAAWGQSEFTELVPLEGTVVPALPSEMGLADDPDGGQHLFINLTGPAAQWLFEQLNAKPGRNECIGGTSKFGPNGSHCVRYNDDTYECNLALDPATDTLAGAWAC